MTLFGAFTLFILNRTYMTYEHVSKTKKKNKLQITAYIQVSQKWRTNGARRCRSDYRKRQKNV
jgi:hypothetical protein